MDSFLKNKDRKNVVVCTEAVSSSEIVRATANAILYRERRKCGSAPVLDTPSHLRCSWKATRTDGVIELMVVPNPSVRVFSEMRQQRRKSIENDGSVETPLFSIHLPTCAAAGKLLELTAELYQSEFN